MMQGCNFIGIRWFENKWLIGLLFVVLLTSCEKSLDYQIDSQDAQFVMYAFPMADSALEVHASYSTDILSVENYTEVEDLVVSVKINSEDDFVSDYTSSEWLTLSSITLKENDTIQISFNLNDSTISSAMTIIPEAVDIMSVDTSSVLDYNEDNEEELMLDCKLTFTDPIEDNYYLLRVDLLTQSTSTNEWVQETITYEEEDKVFTSGDYETLLLADVDYQGTFDDLLINGQEYELEILIPNEYLVSSSEVSEKIFVFYLYSLSEEYYLYVRSVNEQEAYRDDPLYEESNVYTNVSNGLGLVGGLSVSVDSMLVSWDE